MSDIQQRRYGDARMDKLETTIEIMKDDLGQVKQKIFNGFSHSIASTEEKVNYIDDRNREDHAYLIKSIESISDKVDKKFDKIMWVWAGGSVSIFVGVASYIIKGLLE